MAMARPAWLSGKEPGIIIYPYSTCKCHYTLKA